MTDSRAIEVRTALIGLIQDRYPCDEFGSGLELPLHQAPNGDSPMSGGILIVLDRVAINASLRNLSECTAAGSRRRYRRSCSDSGPQSLLAKLQLRPNTGDGNAAAADH